MPLVGETASIANPEHKGQYIFSAAGAFEPIQERKNMRRLKSGAVDNAKSLNTLWKALE